jgi:hypothetical protein
MKRVKKFLELAAIAAVCLAAGSLLFTSCRLFFPAESGWEYVGERRFTEGGTMEAPFFWVDAQGRPCILYSEMDDSFSIELRARVLSSGTWESLGGNGGLIDGNAMFAPGGPFPATLDAAGNPVFLYRHSGDSAEIIAWRLSGGSWVQGASIPDSEYDPDAETSIWREPACIALAPSGEVIAGFRVSESSTGVEATASLRFFVLGDGAFTSSSLPDHAAGGTSYEYALAYGPDGTAYLVSAEQNGSNGYALSAFSLSGGAWTPLGSNALPGAYRGTILFDGDGVPNIAFMENLAQDFGPRVYALVSGTWTDAAPTLAGIVSESSYFSAASLQDGAIALAFIDSTTMAGEVSVIRATGGSWAYLGLSEFTNGHCAGCPSLSAGADGGIYLAHTEIKEDDRISVMEYLGF